MIRTTDMYPSLRSLDVQISFEGKYRRPTEQPDSHRELEMARVLLTNIIFAIETVPTTHLRSKELVFTEKTRQTASPRVVNSDI